MDYTEVNYDKGLENFAGDKGDYCEIMGCIADSCDEDLQELKGYYETKDFENFIIKVHGMKSQCFLLGGDNMGEQAKFLEFAGKENRIGDIDNTINEFEKNYRSFVGQLLKYVAEQ